MAAFPEGGGVVIFIFFPRGNPVKFTDPDGSEYVKPDTRMGQKAHLFFDLALRSSLLSRSIGEHVLFFQDRTLRTIVREMNREITGDPTILAQRAPDVDELASPANRPDFVAFPQIGTKLYVDVYELKPIASAMGYKYEAAKKQINSYITEIINTGAPARGGDGMITGKAWPFPEAGKKATITFMADSLVKGLYYYKIDDGMDN
jgi:hypothetical protein